MSTEAICRAVAERQPQLLSFLEGIVNLDSPTDDKELSNRVGDVLQRKAESLGFSCRRDPQSAYGDNRICHFEPKTKSGRPCVLLVGHYDTIFPAGTVSDRPFRIDGERATGPGIYDMKAGLAVGIFAVEALQAVLPEHPLPITFIFNSDEEFGSPASRNVIVEEAARHDLALILEAGDEGPAVITARKGVGKFTLTVEGVEAHAGVEPEKGVNSIIEMMHKIQAVEALADPALGTTLTPTLINGGSNPFVVPARTELSLDCRVPTEEEQRRVVAGLNAIAAGSWVPGARTTLSGFFHRPPMVADKRARDYVALLQTAAASAGVPLATATTGGASDGNLTAAAGTPTIDGLGADGAWAHSPNEYIEIASLETRCRALACFLAALANPGQRRSGS